MSPVIERFAIRGLHGTRDYDIPIRENRVVMVGVNGLGKTTVVNLLYLILSRQWERSLAYSFRAIEITIDGQVFKIDRQHSHENVSDLVRRIHAGLLGEVPTQYVPQDHGIFEQFARALLKHGRDGFATALDDLLQLPSPTCRKFAANFEFTEKPYDANQLRALDEKLRAAAGAFQVLYLPTYRRIEKELSLLFPDFKEAMRGAPHRRPALFGEREYRRVGFIELVEFGMEDVELTFAQVQSELVSTARSELNGLAGGYLRDVIRGEGETYQIDTFRNLDDATIDRVLKRAEEKTLQESDKVRLRAVIEKLKTHPPDGLQAVDKYIAHFFSKLLSVDRALSDKEKVLIRFTEVCNRYLDGKRIVYDDKDSSLTIQLSPSGSPLSLKSLSSGEKQIVSLFSHLYLCEKSPTMVIIDEPELSLSVIWQKQLLPDILDTKKCGFLAAVTHSPFIFENELDPYTVSLKDCITEVASEPSR